MKKDAVLAVLEADSERLARAGRPGLDLAVPPCPGWTVAHVVAHVGRAYNWVAEILETRTQAPLGQRPDDHGHDPAAPGLLAWFEASSGRFQQAVQRIDPEEPVWSWSGDNRAHFWMRLMAHETAIHRHDAQSAHGTTEPIDAALARDAIEGFLAWFLPVMRQRSLVPSGGEAYLFRQTDGDGVWSVRFGPGSVVVEREEQPAGVTASGCASDLLLFPWRRVPATRLAVSGDSAMLDRYFELAPPY
jgi:uncharacterized protein (TIGR03083 family)